MIPRWFTSALAAAALSAAFAACSKQAASPSNGAATGAAPAGAPASTQAVDIEAEAKKAAAAIDESNADEELARLKAEIESE